MIPPFADDRLLRDDEIDEDFIAAMEAEARRRPDGVAREQDTAVIVLENLEARSVRALLEDTSLAEPEPVVEGVMALGELTVLGGPPKAMKSWTVKSLGLCIASGKPWLGFTVPKPFRTIYLSAEGREARLRARFEKLIGFTPVDEDGLDRMEYVATLGRLKLDTDPGERTFFRLIEPFEVVIVDPLYRFQAEGDENSHRDQRPVHDVLDRVKGLGKCVVVVHHTRKATGIDTGISELRGAGLDGFADGIIMLARKRDKDNDRFTMRFTIRNAEEPPDMELVREGVVLVPALREERGLVSSIDVARVLEDLGGELSAARLYAQLREAKGVSLATAERSVALAAKTNRIAWRPSGGRGQGRTYFVVNKGDE